MNATIKKAFSYAAMLLGVSVAVLCAITLRFVMWDPELLQTILQTIFE